MKLIFLILPLFLFSCSDTLDLAQKEVEKKAMDKLRSELVILAESSISSIKYKCNFIGLGSKPCGGHWEYLIYSSSIDTDKFLTKVEVYNKLEKEFNQKWGVLSDCSLVVPPDSVICKEGK